MRISIVGVGRVGSTIAYALCLRGLCDELLLCNRTRSIAEGETADLEHALPFGDHLVDIKAVDSAGTAGSDIIILCASAKVESVETRNDLGPANIALYREMLPEIVDHSPNAIYLVVANPVDVLTYYICETYSLPWHRVFGTGTAIDSARYRWLLSRKLQIHPQDLRAYILGEHGDSQFVAHSIAQAGGETIPNSPENQAIVDEAIGSGMAVYRAKGYTNFAIGNAVAMMVESIAHDLRKTMPLSVKLDDYCGISDICLSVPVVLGRQGITRVLHPDFNTEEQAAFQASADAVRASMAICNL